MSSSARGLVWMDRRRNYKVSTIRLINRSARKLMKTAWRKFAKSKLLSGAMVTACSSFNRHEPSRHSTHEAQQNSRAFARPVDESQC
jgi:hypothetical protein